MKTFLVLCVVLVARTCAEFSPPFPKQYDDIVEACRVETGYTDQLVSKEEATFFSENRGLRKFNYCFLQKTGFITIYGTRYIDKRLKKRAPRIFYKMLKSCYRKEKTLPRSFFSTCFHGRVSVYMRLWKFKCVIKSQIDNFPLIVDVCRNVTGYTDEVLAEEEKTELSKDSGLKKFNSCFLDKTGFEASDEKFDIDEILGEIPQSNTTEMIEHCQSILSEREIPNNVPNFSACLHLAVSGYLRTSKPYHYAALPETTYVTDIVEVCRTETGFTDVVFDEETERTLRNFNDCFLEKTGFITSDGTLNIDETLRNFPNSFVKPIVEHCQYNIWYPMYSEDVYGFSSCYHDGVVNYMRIVDEPFLVSTHLVAIGTSFAKNFLIV